MNYERKSVLGSTVLGADEAPKNDNNLALLVSTGAGVGLGGLAGGCTGDGFSILRVLTGAAIGAVTGAFLSFLGGKIKK